MALDAGLEGKHKINPCEIRAGVRPAAPAVEGIGELKLLPKSHQLLCCLLSCWQKNGRALFAVSCSLVMSMFAFRGTQNTAPAFFCWLQTPSLPWHGQRWGEKLVAALILCFLEAHSGLRQTFHTAGVTSGCQPSGRRGQHEFYGE